MVCQRLTSAPPQKLKTVKQESQLLQNFEIRLAVRRGLAVDVLHYGWTVRAKKSFLSNNTSVCEDDLTSWSHPRCQIESLPFAYHSCHDSPLIAVNIFAGLMTIKPT